MPSAIFLDRDGVIIENRPNYVRSWDDVFIFPQALEALAKISASQSKIIIVTNQSVIGRGLASNEKIGQINRRLVNKIRNKGGRIDGLYLCPHTPEDKCPCRKPNPGMLFQAAREHSIDLKNSIMIGDALTDLMAARAAGINLAALVRTGLGVEHEHRPEAAQLAPFPVYNTLADAINALKLV